MGYYTGDNKGLNMKISSKELEDLWNNNSPIVKYKKHSPGAYCMISELIFEHNDSDWCVYSFSGEKHDFYECYPVKKILVEVEKWVSNE